MTLWGESALWLIVTALFIISVDLNRIKRAVENLKK